MKKILVLSIAILLFTFSSKAYAATLLLSPSSGNIKAGDTITVDVMLDTKGADIDGVDVYSLHYNASILEVVDSNSSASGVQISPGSLFPITLTNKVTSGVIQFSQVTSGGTSYNGSGKLATITFKGLANGTSAVTFDFTPGSTSDTNVAGGGTDKLTSATGGSYTVTGGGNPPPPPPPDDKDTTPPVISAISASSIKSTSASVIWTTNEASDSSVEYGLTSSYGSSSTYSSSLLTLHSRSLTNLKPSTTYHYRVKSKDSSGNLAVSGDKTFTTLSSSADTSPTTTTTQTPTPNTSQNTNSSGNGTTFKISAIYSSGISTSSAIITWRTDKPSSSQVEYGTSDTYESVTEVNSSLVMSHSSNIMNLLPDTLYHYRVRSIDDAGNLTFSDDRTFTTLKGLDTANKTWFQKFIDWLVSFFV